MAKKKVKPEKKKVKSGKKKVSAKELGPTEFTDQKDYEEQVEVEAKSK